MRRWASRFSASVACTSLPRAFRMKSNLWMSIRQEVQEVLRQRLSFRHGLLDRSLFLSCSWVLQGLLPCFAMADREGTARLATPRHRLSEPRRGVTIHTEVLLGRLPMDCHGGCAASQ